MEEKNNGEITRENCFQKLFDYATDKYEDLAFKVRRQCTYKMEMKENDFAFKQTMSWFVAEYKLPETGETPIEEFVRKFVAGKDGALAKDMLREIKNLVSGEFKVIQVKDNIITLEHTVNGRTYEAELLRTTSPKEYERDRRVECKLFKWGEYYRFWGINTIKPSLEELSMQLGIPSPEMFMARYKEGEMQKAESRLIYTNSSLSSILNKYTANWINGAAKSLGCNTKGRKDEKIRQIISCLYSVETNNVVSALPNTSIDILGFILAEGGVVKYGILERKFGDDDTGIFWKEEPPKSAIGALMLRCLITVGRMPLRGRLYKVAMVPADIREAVSNALKRISEESANS